MRLCREMHVGGNRPFKLILLYEVINMKLVHLMLFLGLIPSCFLVSVAIADIAISEHSSSSVMLTSNKSENSREYILDITVEGVDPRTITVEPHGQMLVLSVNNGRASNALSGRQHIAYTYSFEDDADIYNLLRVNSGGRIRISIPKRKP